MQEEEGVVPPEDCTTIMPGTSTHLSATSLTLYNIIIIVDFFFGFGTLGIMQIASTRPASGSMACLRAYQQPKPSIMQQVLAACSPGLSPGIARGSRLP